MKLSYRGVFLLRRLYSEDLGTELLILYGSGEDFILRKRSQSMTVLFQVIICRSLVPSTARSPVFPEHNLQPPPTPLALIS
jgi:hypothetical protein